MAVDMFPQAVTQRLRTMDELWLLSMKLMEAKKVTETMKYKVKTEHNFDMDGTLSQYQTREFDSRDEAIDFAKAVVDNWLESALSKGKAERFSSSDELYEHYTSFGVDPSISFDGKMDEFSSWRYAKQRCYEIMGAPAEQADNPEADEVEEPYENLDFFPLKRDEEFIKYELLGMVHKISSDPSRTPLELKNLAIVRLALERLPKTTPAVHIVFGIVLRDGGEMMYCDLSISADRFSLSSGGHSYSPGIGGDSHGGTLFECESSGFRDGSTDPWDIGSWHANVQELLNLGAELSFENESDESEIDWDFTFEVDPWDELEERIRRWEETGS